MNSVQLGMQGLDALLCPLLGLERPQSLAGVGGEAWRLGQDGQRARGSKAFSGGKTISGLLLLPYL